jgi:hypothetical protein
MIQTVEALIIENKHLQEIINSLEQKLSFLTRHTTLSAGIAGETLIGKIIKGQLTPYAESFDVVSSEGALIEVKFANLNRALKTSDTMRWAWGKIFGEGGQKRFDYLVLIGDKDKRWVSSYKDIESPFVIFCIPIEKIAEFTMSSHNNRYRSIQLTTNPQTATKSRARHLYTRYQVTAKELSDKFGL